MLKFTIITVCYNAEKTIKTTMQSVITQTYHNKEYLVIDGASTDNTLQIAAKIAEQAADVAIYSEKDLGIYNAMNRGIVRATGDYVIFMNAGDEFYRSDVLEKLSNVIEKNGCAIYYGRTYAVKNGKQVRLEEFADTPKPELQKFFEGKMPVHQSIVAPTCWLKRYYFDERYKYRADFDWLVKCYRAKVPLRFVDFVVSKYDLGGVTSRMRVKKELKKETKQIMKANYPIVSKIWDLFHYYERY